MKKSHVIFAIGIMLLITSLLPSMNAYSNNVGIGKDYSSDLVFVDQLIDDFVEKFGRDWYYKPSSYNELVSWYLNLEFKYPDYIEVFKANELYGTGKVTGGYDLFYVRITNESLGLHKPEVLFLGSPHGDETVGTISMYWFTDWLARMAFTDEPCQDYSKDWLQWLIDNREIYFEVSHNPYGFDHVQREDGNYWDLNREADMDGPGSGGPPSIWASVNGKTLRAFVDNHTIRLGCDFHGGVRMLLYPWGSTHSSIIGISPITGYSYTYAPPDFYFFDASSLRLGDYIGDYGGNLNKYSIGTIPPTVGYSVKGGICPWAYGADVLKNPLEDPYVNDETWGNYPGAGILWLSPEMSITKNPAESTFGNDTIVGYGAEVRRIILYQADLAQPYVRWLSGTVENNSMVSQNTELDFCWQVNGSLVVDHTYIQWGTNPNPIEHWDNTTLDYDEHAGDFLGGTGWDDAENGQTIGVVYNEKILMDKGGDYYFVAIAQVDQVYKDVLRSDVYGDNPYLRIIKERTNGSYYEMINGTDGLEEVFGHFYWYSPVVHVTVNDPPSKPEKPSGSSSGKIGVKYLFSTTAVDPNNDELYYLWDWGDGSVSDWLGPWVSGEIVTESHQWNMKGKYLVRVKARDVYGEESSWSESLEVSIPRCKVFSLLFFDFVQKYFPRLYRIFEGIINPRMFVYDYYHQLRDS